MKGDRTGHNLSIFRIHPASSKSDFFFRSLPLRIEPGLIYDQGQLAIELFVEKNPQLLRTVNIFASFQQSL
ncbi:hypothetical protein BGS_0210 [Beggiatoa sp. SS]|nr:hypothetical protein BGS_0210 [Beggiatoa sp. SS]